MSDSPSQAFRRKKDSSVHVAAKLVKEGAAEALVSAGNTGAVMTVARFVLGTLAAVDRPALAAAFPNAKEKLTVILDVGANVDSKPEQIEQFAVMGEIYYRTIFGTKRPRVALLSIGEEEMKGNELTREAAARLKLLPMNFVGNVEGRDVFKGRRRRDRLRRLHRQYRSENQRRPGRTRRQHAQKSHQEQHRLPSRLRFVEAGFRQFSQAHRFRRKRAARRFSVSAASRSSATAAPMLSPSKMRFASRLSCAARASTKKSNRSFPLSAVASRG